MSALKFQNNFDDVRNMQFAVLYGGSMHHQLAIISFEEHPDPMIQIVFCVISELHPPAACSLSLSRTGLCHRSVALSLPDGTLRKIATLIIIWLQVTEQMHNNATLKALKKL